MESQPLYSVLSVLGVFAGVLFAIIALVFILRKFKLSNSTYPFAFSIGIGLIFSVGSLGLVLLSTKFDNWSFVDKLIYAAKFFPLVSLAIFVVIESLRSKYKEENEKKIS
jgi:membrane-associated PAP2 superfamily phosphatase